MQRRPFYAGFIAAALLTACGGGGNSTPPVNPTPAPVYKQHLFVSEGDLNQIAVLDAQTGSLITTIAVGKTPTKISYSSYTHSLWVANAGDNSVTKIDTNTLKVVGTVSVGSDPEWVDASGVNGSYDVVDVASRGSKTVTQLKASDMSVLGTMTTSGAPVSVNDDGNLVTEDNGRVVFFQNSPPSPNSTAAFTVANGLQGAAFLTNVGLDGTNYLLVYTAYDGMVSEYVPVTSNSGYITGLTPATTFKLAPGAGQIYAAGNDVIVVNDVTKQAFDIDVRHSEMVTASVGNEPGGADSDGYTDYVANRGDDTVSVFDAFTGKAESTFHLAAGAHPEDVAYQSYTVPGTPTPAPSATPTATPTAAPTSTPTTSPTSTPAATQHLYVANGSAGNVLEYTSPFSASSTPTVNLNIGGNVWGVASDSNYVAIEDSTGYIYIFAQPLSASASPVAQFKAGSGAQLLFDSSGNLYTGDEHTEVLEYSPPFSATSTPAKVINGTSASFSLAMDYNNNLYAGDLGMNQIEIFASPHSGPPTQVAQPGTYGLASYATYLYGADAASGKIYAYNLPMSASSTPAFTISNTDPHAVAADTSTGTLYVGDQHGGGGSGSIDVYSQPLSGSSTASYSITSGVSEPVQVWVGP